MKKEKDRVSHYLHVITEKKLLEVSIVCLLFKNSDLVYVENLPLVGFILNAETKFVLQKVKHELLVVYTDQLLEKEHSESHALLRDDKVLVTFLLFTISFLAVLVKCNLLLSLSSALRLGTNQIVQKWKETLSSKNKK